VEFWLTLFQFFGETLAVFEFVEVGWDGVGRACACGLLEKMDDGEVRNRAGGDDEIPRAFNSLQACSQALTSLEEMYTFAPFCTKPSEIMRPMPFAPPVTRTTLP
jgi:hypothetical protein